MTDRKKGTLKLAATSNTKKVTGVVRWFNPVKGFGFIARDDGGKDIFVHRNAVAASGLETLADEQPVSFEITEGKNGRNCATNLEIRTTSKQPAMHMIGGTEHRVFGVIIWFDPTKGFGYIVRSDDGDDVFVHANQLRESGINNHPTKGQTLSFRVQAGRKGPHAIDISYDN